MDRFERLLNLAHVVSQSRTPVSFDTLKDLFPDYRGNHEAARRKFERDKKELENIGLELTYHAADEESEGGYTLPRNQAYLPDLDLSDEERKIVVATLQSALLDQSFPFRKALRQAYSKLDPSPPQSLTLALDSIATETLNPEILQTLFVALSRRKTACFSYRKVDHEPTDRKVDIHRLFVDQGLWYVSGFDHDRGAIRVFRCSRINDPSFNTKKPAQSDYEIPLKSDTRKRLERPHRFPIHEEIEVHFSLDDDLFFLVDPIWKPSRNGDRGTVKVTNIEGFVDTALRLGSRIEVLNPPEARNAMRKRIRSALARQRGAK